MKKFLVLLAVVVGLVVLVIAADVILTPWMDRWGATEAEINAVYPGDELVPEPASLVTRAVSIHASPEQIFPWLLQMGADKGGLYSYTALENMIRCPQVNADRIHPEWQDLKVGDPVKMCPTEFGPVPYTVAQILPNKAIVMGHQENGKWIDLWQFILAPQGDGNTRLILRTRTMMTGGIWDVIHPGVFVMERAMLLGIRDRAQ